MTKNLIRNIVLTAEMFMIIGTTQRGLRLYPESETPRFFNELLKSLMADKFLFDIGKQSWRQKTFPVIDRREFLMKLSGSLKLTSVFAT